MFARPVQSKNVQSTSVQVRIAFESGAVLLALAFAYGWWMMFRPVGWVEYRLVGCILVSLGFLVAGVWRWMNLQRHRFAAGVWVTIGSLGMFVSAVLIWIGGR